MTVTPSSAGREIARKLLAREIAGVEEPAAISAAMQRALTRVAENLRRSVGDDGYHALLSRAITRTRASHPALGEMHRAGEADISLNGVHASLDAHGVPVVTAALETLLASLADVLSGLIGADMVMNLLDPDGPLPELPRRGQAR